MAYTTTSTTPPTRIDKQTTVSCPFLGTSEDKAAFFTYPSEGNYCHRPTQPAPVSEAYQQSACLTARHTACPVFQTDWRGAFPKEMADDIVHPLNQQKRLFLALIISALILTGVAIAYFGFGPGKFLINSGLAHDPTSLALNAPTDTYPIPSTTPTGIPTTLPTSIPIIILPPQPDTETPTLPPPPTATSTILPPTPGPEMATPFGPQKRYLLHTVQDKESLANIAHQYLTSVEMIKALNFFIEGASVWPGRVLVITPQIKDVNAATLLCVFRLDVATTVSDFTAQYGLTPDDLRRYNELGPDEEITTPRWLIFPYSDMNTPDLCR
jgi:hypothetical protein